MTNYGENEYYSHVLWFRTRLDPARVNRVIQETRPYVVYVIKREDGSHYVGQTARLWPRLKTHCLHGPLRGKRKKAKVVLLRVCPNRDRALRAELELQHKYGHTVER